MLLCKNRSQVTASKSKPYKQKGTGRARRGSKKSPLLVGGGVVFGPSPRFSKLTLNNKFFKQFNRHFINFVSDKSYVLDYSTIDLKLSSFLNDYPDLLDKKVSFVTTTTDINLLRVISNVRNFNFYNFNDLNLSSLFASDFIVFTPNSLNQFSTEVL